MEIVIAGLALLVSVAAVGVTWWYGRRQARAAEESATASKDALRENQRLVAVERDREHDRLSPGPIPTLKATLEPNTRDRSLPGSLMAEVALTRDCRVRARAVTGDSYHEVGLPLLLHAGRTYRFEIESWPSERRTPRTEYVLFQFGPPVEADGVDVSPCPCDRAPADLDNPNTSARRGHWEIRAEIDYQAPSQPAAAFVPTPPHPRRI